MKNIMIESKVFREKNFESEIFSKYRLYDCEFINCSFKDCTLEDVELSNCYFKACDLISLEFKNSIVRNIVIEESNLIGTNWSHLVNTNAGYSNPIDKLTASFLKYNSFFEMTLKNTDLSSNTYQDCIFSDSNLSMSSFKGSQFNETQFIACDLSCVDFRDARGYMIDMNTNRIKKAKFSYPEVQNLLNFLDIEIE